MKQYCKKFHLYAHIFNSNMQLKLQLPYIVYSNRLHSDNVRRIWTSRIFIIRSVEKNQHQAIIISPNKFMRIYSFYHRWIFHCIWHQRGLVILDFSILWFYNSEIFRKLRRVFRSRNFKRSSEIRRGLFFYSFSGEGGKNRPGLPRQNVWLGCIRWKTIMSYRIAFFGISTWKFSGELLESSFKFVICSYCVNFHQKKFEKSVFIDHGFQIFLMYSKKLTPQNISDTFLKENSHFLNSFWQFLLLFCNFFPSKMGSIFKFHLNA